ncbi:MAG: ATPase, partial [Methanobrevibacter sp.]|nr:ATPase [Methanobrevibacter sp.]
RKDHLVLPIGKKFVGCSFDILLEDKYLFTATVGKRGYVKLHKNLDLTEEIMEGLDQRLREVARVRD